MYSHHEGTSSFDTSVMVFERVRALRETIVEKMRQIQEDIDGLCEDLEWNAPHPALRRQKREPIPRPRRAHYFRPSQHRRWARFYGRRM